MKCGGGGYLGGIGRLGPFEKDTNESLTVSPFGANIIVFTKVFGSTRLCLIGTPKPNHENSRLPSDRIYFPIRCENLNISVSD